MFAVIRTGGKQYRVAPNDIIKIEKIAGEPGDIVELGEVLLLGGANDAPKTGGHKAGGATIAGALVAAELLEHTRGDKITVFKKKRRKNYRRKKGHRQELTMLRITEILTDGKKPSQAKVARAEPKKAEAKPKAPEAKAAPKAKAKAAPKAEKKPAAKKAAPAKKAAAAKKPAAKAAAKKPAAKPAKKK
jgi:large subunit ribosomal protein L21